MIKEDCVRVVTDVGVWHHQHEITPNYILGPDLWWARVLRWWIGAVAHFKRGFGEVECIYYMIRGYQLM